MRVSRAAPVEIERALMNGPKLRLCLDNAVFAVLFMLAIMSALLLKTSLKWFLFACYAVLPRFAYAFCLHTHTHYNRKSVNSHARETHTLKVLLEV